MADDVVVTVDPDFGRAKTQRSRLCEACGGELEDRRKRFHDECKPEPVRTSTLKQADGRPSGGRVRGKGKTKVSDATQKGMVSITGKILYLLTLFLAWQMLRGVGVPDYTGDIADSMAMTDDEAEMIGRPLSRIFLRTEGGRKLAPVLVENEDGIDAAFALWDWYRRMVTTMDQYRREQIPSNQMDTPPPIRRERGNGNGNTRPVEADREESEGVGVGYIPPSPIDLLGA
jgi:hypothetical protein